MRKYVGDQNPLFEPSERGSDGCFPYRESPFYIWWECLRRNSDYKLAFDLGGKLASHKELARFERLIVDFGDVWSSDFEEWWNEPLGGEKRGEYLFAEPLAKDGVRRLSKAEALSFIETWDQKNYMLLAVPISMYSEEFRASSNAIYGQRYELKGQERPKSRARYQFSRRVRMDGLSYAIAIYDMTLQEPDTELWVHAMRYDPAYNGLDRTALEGKQHLGERQSLSQKASRARGTAVQMIEAVGYGVFPRRDHSETRRQRTPQ